MVGQDASAGMHTIGSTVGGNSRVGRRFSNRVRAARTQGGVFRSRDFASLAKAFRAACIEKADAAPQVSDHLQQVQRGYGDRLNALNRLLK